MATAPHLNISVTGKLGLSYSGDEERLKVVVEISLRSVRQVAAGTRTMNGPANDEQALHRRHRARLP